MELLTKTGRYLKMIEELQKKGVTIKYSMYTVQQIYVTIFIKQIDNFYFTLKEKKKGLLKLTEVYNEKVKECLK